MGNRCSRQNTCRAAPRKVLSDVMILQERVRSFARIFLKNLFLFERDFLFAYLPCRIGAEYLR